MHSDGCGAKYTRGRGPVKLVYYEVFENRKDAMKREYEIKKLTRKDKLALIGTYKAENRYK
jgi:putative endonuclease